MQAKASDKKVEDDPVVAESHLRLAREAAGISVDEVADRLHLDRNVILSIEEGDFEVLGAPVFVKGHLRSYARLLGLPEDEITASLMTSEPEAEEFRTLSAPSIVKAGAKLSNFVLWVSLALIVLVAAIYLLAGGDDVEESDFVTPTSVEKSIVSSAGVTELAPKKLTTPAPVIADASVQASATDSEDDTDEGKEDDKNADKDIAVETPAEPDAGIAVVSAPPEKAADKNANNAVPASPAVLADQQPEADPRPTAAVAEPVTLSLAFAEECWIEVSDSQRRLLYGLEKAGTQRVLTGTLPFRLFLGNTDAVTIRVAGQEYVVPGAVRTGSNTARFSIDNDVLLGMQE